MPLFLYKKTTAALKAKSTAVIFMLILILNTNKIQEKISAEILYMRDCRLDFFQILNGV